MQYVGLAVSWIGRTITNNLLDKNMKEVSVLPWELEIDNQRLDAVLYKVENGRYKCEFESEGKCSPQPFCIGTSDSREPKFCFEHYFENCEGDGITSYRIVANYNEA